MELVLDASTLILLAKTEILGLILKEFRIVIPVMVRREGTQKETFDSRLIASFIEKGMIEVRTANKRLTRSLMKDFKLHSGEAEALAVAIQERLPVAVDDLLTIKACKILGVKFSTAIHLLLWLSRKGRIERDMALVKLERLSHYGRYNKRIITDVRERLTGGK